MNSGTGWFPAAALLGVILLAGWYVGRWVARRMGGTVERTDGGLCGACGYNVRGVPSLACPECGKDLREVGIEVRGPAKRRLLRRAAGGGRVVVPPVVRAGVWTVSVVLTAGVVTPWVMEHLVPKITDADQHFALLYPHKSRFERVDFRASARQVLWPWSQPKRVMADTVEVTISPWRRTGQPPVVMNYRVMASEYTYQRRDGTRFARKSSLDAEAVLEWLLTSGVEVDGEEGPLVATQIAAKVYEAQSLSMGRTLGDEPFAGRVRGTTGAVTTPWRAAYPILFGVWVVVWGVGLSHAFPRRRRRGSPERNAARSGSGVNAVTTAPNGGG